MLAHLCSMATVSMQGDDDLRVLVLPPTSRDGEILKGLLTHFGMAVQICADMRGLCEAMTEGVGAVLCTQEAVLADASQSLNKILETQEDWSDVPVIVLTPPSGDSPSNAQRLDKIGHMTLIRRPVQIANLMTTLRSALRDRRRQYGLRDLLSERLTQEEAARIAANKANAANIAKSDFLANMSHEIRTPMNAIIGLTTLLSRSRPLTQPQQKFINTLSLSAESLLMLINDLLDISKIEASAIEIAKEAFRLDRLIYSIAELSSVRAQEKGLDVDVDVEAVKDIYFLGDRGRVHQVVANLCANAVKFTSEGAVRISAKFDDGVNGQNCVVIAVADSGIGIDQEKLERIFEKFTQADNSISRKFGGTGLGLAISKTLAELMGGAIQVVSHPGKGSIFSLVLPLEIADTPPIDVAAYRVESKSGQRAQGRVLLVEDHEANVLVARSFLELFGYEVDLAENGAEAVAMAANAPYCAILMDVQMPVMDGFEATRAIRKTKVSGGLNFDTPIIGMTAHALDNIRQKCLDSGMNDYVSKPFSPAELEKKLDLSLANQ